MNHATFPQQLALSATCHRPFPLHSASLWLPSLGQPGGQGGRSADCPRQPAGHDVGADACQTFDLVSFLTALSRWFSAFGFPLLPPNRRSIGRTATTLLAGSIAMLIAASQVHAATFTWQNTGSDFADAASWSPSGPPVAATDLAQFSTFGTFSNAAVDPVVNSDVTSRLWFGDTASGSGYTLSGNGTLTGGNSGASGLMTRGIANTTISLGSGTATSLALTGGGASNFAIDVGSGSTLTLGGNMIATANGAIIRGTLVLDNSAGNPNSGGSQRLAITGNNFAFVGGGATLEFKSASEASAFAINQAWTFKSGYGTVRLNQTGAAGSLAVTGTSLSMTNLPGAVVNFVSAGFGTLGGGGANDPTLKFTSAPGLTNGVVASGRAIVNGTDFATYDETNGISAVVSTPVSGALVSAPTQNSVLSGDATLTGNSSVTYNTLKIAPTAAGQSLAMEASALNALGILLSGNTSYAITGGPRIFSVLANRYSVFVSDPGAVLSVDTNFGPREGTTGGFGVSIMKGGDGFLWLNGTANQVNYNRGSAIFMVGNGVLRVNSTSFNLTTNNAPVVAFRGGTLEYDVSGGAFTFNRALGGTATAGRVSWQTSTTDTGSGGFSAYAGPGEGNGNALTVNLGGASAALTWGSTTNFVSDGYALKFGSVKSNSTVIFQNPLALDSGTPGDYAIRQIDVTKGVGNAADKTQLTGAITGSSTTGLVKTGDGVLELTGTNTYTGETKVSAGTLYVNGDNSAAAGNVTVTGGTLSGIGTIGGNVTVQSGGTITAGANATSGGHLTTKDLTLLDGSTALFKLTNPNNLIPVIMQGGILTSSGNITLSLQLIDGYNGNLGDTFKLFAYDQRNFGTTNLLINTNLSNGLAWDTSFLASQGMVLIKAGTLAATHWLGQTDSNWSGANWASNGGGNATTATPTSADDITFSATGAANQTNTVLDVDATIASLTVSDSVGITGNKTLSVNGATNVNAGTLTLSGGVTVFTGFSSTIDGAGSDVAVTVSGAGSTWTTTDDLIVGNNANGTLNVNGGAVSSYRLYVGNNGGSSGTVTLTGGTIDAGFLTLGAQSGSTGTLNIGTFGGNSTAGTLVAAEVNGGSGTATVNFNQTDDYFTFAPKITGSASVNQLGTGTTVLDQNNTYTGETTVAAGLLIINGNNTAATGNVTVQNGGTLRGSGTLGGNITVQSGGTISGGPGGSSFETLTTTQGLSLLDGSSAVFRFAAADSFEKMKSSSITATGNIILSLQLPFSYTGAANDSFQIFNADSYSIGSANFNVTSNLDSQFKWDLTGLSSNGTVKIALAAPAATHWLGQTDNNWSGANWASNAAGNAITATPTSADDITFSATGAANKTNTVFDLDTTIKSLTVESSAGIQGNQTLTINEVTKVSAGTLTLAGGVKIVGNRGLAIEDGTLTVTGNGTRATFAGVINVGYINAGTGTLNVTAGGQVSTDRFIPVGNKGVGIVNVDGAGSKLTSAYELVLGYFGTTDSGTLNITNGGVVKVSSYGAYIGSAGIGSATVDGADSALNVDGEIILASRSGANGTLNIQNGGLVSVGNGTGTLTLGAQSGSTGTLNIGSPITPGATGTLQAAEVHGGSGTAILNFNHNQASYKFDPKITGSTAVNQNGPGRTVIAAANTYTGPTSINAGVVQTENASALGTGAVTINGGALRAIGQLNVSDLTWNAGTIGLAPVGGDVINVSGDFTSGAGGGGLFALAPEGLMTNQVYTLVNFNSSNFNLNQFSAIGNDPGVQFSSTFLLNPGSVQIIITGATASGTRLDNIKDIPVFADFTTIGSVVSGLTADGFQELQTFVQNLFVPNSSLIVPTPNVLTVTGFMNMANSSLTVNGRLNVLGNFTDPNSTINVTGTMSVGGNTIIDGNSTLTVATGGTFSTTGSTSFTNSTANVNGTLTTGTIFNSSASTVIVNGSLGIGSTAAFENNSSLTLNTGAVMTVGGNTGIAGNTTLTIASGATMNTAGSTSITDSTANVSGTLSTGSNFNAASGTVSVNGAVGVVGSAGFNNNSRLTVNPSALLNVGGTTSINSGSQAVINGRLTSPQVNVSSGGLLTGAGLIAGNVLNSGTVAPGNSPGTLTITGGYTQGSTGNLIMEIASQAVFDRLIVGGNANLGGTLQLLSLGYQFAYGQQFQLLQAGSISGQFDSIAIPDPSNYRARFLVSGGTGTLLIAPASYALMAQTQNQKNVAKALNSFISATSGDKQTVSLALDLQSESAYPAAFDAISPALYESLTETVIEQTNARTQMLAQRASAVRLGARGFQSIGIETPLKYDRDGRSVMDAKDGKNILSPADDNNWGVWVQANGIFAHAAGFGGVSSYNSQNGGFLVGGDYRWSENFVTGVYGGYQGTYSKYGNGGVTTINGVDFGVYAGYQNGGFYTDAIIGGGSSSYAVRRPINFSTVDRTATSRPNGGQFTSYLGLGYDWQAGNFTFGPILSGQYTYAGIAPFTEDGAGALDLAVGEQNANSLRTSLGGRVAYTWKISNTIAIIPEGRLLWQHEFLEISRNIGASLNGGGGPSFDYTTSAPACDAVFAGTGISAQFGPNWNAYFYYNADFGRQDYISHSISTGLNFKF